MHAELRNQRDRTGSQVANAVAGRPSLAGEQADDRRTARFRG
jgi:hypothetical protein